MELRRARLALLLPVLALLGAAGTALLIGFFLHQVPNGTAPAAALFLVLVVTAGGFIASYGLPKQ
jgi:hypothetical protein